MKKSLKSKCLFYIAILKKSYAEILMKVSIYLSQYILQIFFSISIYIYLSIYPTGDDSAEVTHGWPPDLVVINPSLFLTYIRYIYL